MALVAYDNSDSSEFEDDEKVPAPTATFIAKREEKAGPFQGPSISNSVTQNGLNVNDQSVSLFNLLPQPSSKKPAVIEEEDDEFLYKKETVPNTVKPKARITVPSLSDFKDVEDSIPTKPRAPSTKKSGLLSMLPQPKNGIRSTTTSKSLIPHVLTQKPQTTTAKKKTPVPSFAKMAKVEAKTSLAIDYSDESDDDAAVTDFFSFNKPVDLPPDDSPLDIDAKPTKHSEQVTNVSAPSNQKQTRNIQSYFKQNSDDNNMELQSDESSYNNGESSSYGAPANIGYENGSSQESSSNDVILDEEAIRQLCGSRGKRKREDIQIVDVNQQEVLADAREWLMKGLMDDTTKRVSSSKKKGNEPTNQQRRKHQITYLAHQAKANEAELQNQWSNNRMSKRQTQSKYGF